MRRIYQFDGLSGSGVLSVGECTEPEQVLLHIEREGANADVRLNREEWQNLMELNYKISICGEHRATTERGAIRQRARGWNPRALLSQSMQTN